MILWKKIQFYNHFNAKLLISINKGLEEERNKLKQTVRKLARQLGTKVNVASIIDEDYLYDNPPSKHNQRQPEPVEKPVQQVAKEPSKKTSETENTLKKRNEQLMQLCLEFENENKLLEKGLKEIHRWGQIK